MKDHIYPVEFIRAVTGSQVELLVDLGFCMKVRWLFHIPHTNAEDPTSTDHNARKQAIYERSLVHEQLCHAEEIYAKVVKQGELYYADITYRLEDGWHNLIEEISKYTNGGEEDSSQ